MNSGIHNHLIRQGLTAILAATLLVAGVGRAAGEGDRAAIDRDFAQHLEKLAAKCDELGIPAEAKITRDWLIRRDPRRTYVFLQIEHDLVRPPGPDAPRLQRFWFDQFVKQRNAHADKLYALYLDRIEQRRWTDAYGLLFEILRENPNHQKARHILGHEQVEQRWYSRQIARRVRAGWVDHPRFGWLSRDNVARYEKGERLLDGRWVTPGEEEKVRGSSIEKGWQIETPHFLITTNHSREAGVLLGRQLEVLYDAWRQLTVRYWGGTAAPNSRFREPILSRRSKHQVYFFRNKDEYVAYLKQEAPRVAMSIGMYDDRKEIACFYVGADDSQATWFHEVTHQLFQETGMASRKAGSSSNFWVIEAIALYMESLEMDRRRGFAALGGVAANRLQFARYRALSEGFHVPLKELVAFSREKFQSDPRIRKIYSQSAGLGHFLINGQQGRYRAAMIDYLTAVYRSRPSTRTLAEKTGQPLEQLDKEYHRFLDVCDEDLGHVGSLARKKRLALGNTSVTDAGIKTLTDPEELVWLDLSFTRTGDASIEHMARARKLDQLSLEKTAVTDAAMKTITGFAALQELDLSRTRVTDAALSDLRDLRSLAYLWLTGTAVTDNGLRHLEGMRQLQMLEVSNSGVTKSGLQDLERKLPRLNRE